MTTRDTAVSRNYAGALFEIAARDGSESLYGELIESLGTVYAESEAFRRFLSAPSVSEEEKKDALKAVFSAQAPELFVRFLMVMLDRRRQGSLPGIAGAFRAELDRQSNQVRADVTLPFAADDQVRDQIVGALEARFEKKVIPEFRVDPKILGGMIIRVGDELMDASVRRQLERMKRELVQ